MAIQWSSSSGYMSVGIEMWWTGEPASGSVQVHAQFWLRSDGYGHNFTAPTQWWGNVGTGSETVSFSSPRGGTVYKDMGTSHWTETLLPNQERSVGAGYSLGPIWNGGHPSVQAWLTLPARPARPPSAPAWCKARLQPDGKSVYVSWPAAKPADASSPIRAYVLERWDAYSDNRSGPWFPREWHMVSWWAVSEGSAVEEFHVIDDRAVYPNDRFWYRVSAAPLIPASARSVSDFFPGPSSPSSEGVSTLPSPVEDLTASKTRDGKISVTWKCTFPYPQDATIEIYDGDDKVGVVRADATSWVHASADLQVPHTYYAYVKSDALESKRSAASNTIQVLQKPGIPGVRSPGAYAPVGQVAFAWSHTSLDETWQEAAQIRYATPAAGGGSPSWTTVSITGNAQEKTIDLPVGTIEYQVRTRGQYREYSEWSPSRRTTITYPPVVAISPDTATLDKSIFDGRITVSHVRGASTTISTVTAELLSADLQVIEQIKGDTSALGVTPTFDNAELRFQARLENKTEYVVRVALADGYGLTTQVERRYKIEYPTPPVPIVTAVWEEHEGDMLISIASPTVPQGAKTPPTVETRLERSIDGGSTWTLIADHLPPSTMYRDRESLTNGTTKYRVTATSAMPSSSVAIADGSADSKAVWLSAGQGYSRVVRLVWNPELGSSLGLVNREVKYFAGRDFGVEMAGTQRQRIVTISATLVDSSLQERQAVEDLAYMPAPFLYRDPLGRVLRGSLSDVQLSREIGGVWKISAKLTEVGA